MTAEKRTAEISQRKSVNIRHMFLEKTKQKSELAINCDSDKSIILCEIAISAPHLSHAFSLYCTVDELWHEVKKKSCTVVPKMCF